MESAVGYVILTSFLIFILLSSTSSMSQYASTANAVSVSVIKSNLLQLVREQLVEAYQGAKVAGCSLSLQVSVPKSIQGKTFIISIDSSSKALVLDYGDAPISYPLPPLSPPSAIWSESRYVSGSGKLSILASWTGGSIALSLSGG